MAETQLTVVLRHLRQRAGAGEISALSDRELLQRFVAQREEAAFATLVARHGPLVLAVCRSGLRNEHDAEDAFQATFLVLARRAASVSWQESAAGWLYEVAARVVAKARASAGRCPRGERDEQAMSSDSPVSVAARRELQRVIGEEVRRLPEKYRLPVILCYLEGISRADAARQLGCPEGTVAGRLARARTLLGKRLTQRGIGLSVGLLASLGANRTGQSAVPSALARTTVRAALIGTGGRTSALADEVMKSLLAAKVHTAAGLVLALGLFAAGAGLVLLRPLAASLPQALPEAETTSPVVAIRPAAIPGEGRPASPPTHADGSSLRHETAVKCVVFSPDGKTLVSGASDADAPVRLWEAETGKELRRLKMPGGALALAFSLDGKLLVSGGGGKTVHLWEAATGRKLAEFRGHEDTVSSLAFSPDGKLLVSGSYDRTVRLWDRAAGKEIGRLPTRRGLAAHAVAISPDGKLLAVGGDNDTGRADTLRLWDLATRKELPVTLGHNGAVTSVAFSRDGKILVSGGMDGSVYFWDIPTGRVLREGSWGLRWRTPIQTVTLSHDGKTVAAGGLNRIIYLWDAHTGQIRGCFSGHALAARTALASASKPSAVDSSRVSRIMETWDGVRSLSFSPDGRTLASAGGSDQRVRLVDVVTGRERSPPDTREPRHGFP
jgi:RNA polymerase sigma factor (sigma-70 family)